MSGAEAQHSEPARQQRRDVTSPALDEPAPTPDVGPTPIAIGARFRRTGLVTLQRSIGNQAVGRLVTGRLFIQRQYLTERYKFYNETRSWIGQLANLEALGLLIDAYVNQPVRDRRAALAELLRVAIIVQGESSSLGAHARTRFTTMITRLQSDIQAAQLSLPPTGTPVPSTSTPTPISSSPRPVIPTLSGALSGGLPSPTIASPRPVIPSTTGALTGGLPSPTIGSGVPSGSTPTGSISAPSGLPPSGLPSSGLPSPRPALTGTLGTGLPSTSGPGASTGSPGTGLPSTSGPGASTGGPGTGLPSPRISSGPPTIASSTPLISGGATGGTPSTGARPSTGGTPSTGATLAVTPTVSGGTPVVASTSGAASPTTASVPNPFETAPRRADPALKGPDQALLNRPRRIVLQGRSYFQGTGSFTSTSETSGREIGSSVETDRREIRTGAKYKVGTAGYTANGNQIGTLLRNAPTIANRIQIREGAKLFNSTGGPLRDPADANLIGTRGAPLAAITGRRRLVANTKFSQGIQTNLSYSSDMEGRAIAGAARGKQRLDFGVSGTADVPVDSPGLVELPDIQHVAFTVGTSTYRVDAADVIALPDIQQVDITLSPTETARAALADVITLPDITWLTLDPDVRGANIRVDQNNTREGALTFASTGAAPLFHAHGPPVLPEDIKQTTLGDCYLQAVMMAIARSDPNFVPQMMQTTGDTVTVRFYETTGGLANAVYIKVDKTLPQTATGTALYNAGAIWARLIQKAFAVFAGMYGKYGGAYSSPRTLGGYADIASGVERMVYGVFYGPALATASVSTVNYDPSSSDATNLLANVSVIKALVEYQGQRPDVGAPVLHLTAGATLTDHLKRLQSVLTLVTLPPTGYATLATQLADMGRQVPPALADAIRVGADAAPDQPRVRSVITLARTIAEGTALKGLARSNPNLQQFQTLIELLNDIKEAGVDTSPGQRFIYSAHAYTVLDVTFSPRAPDSGLLATDPSRALTGLNLLQSTVHMRNPHAANSPNTLGEATTDTGTFTLSLAQFLRNFSALDEGRVTRRS